MYRRHIRSLPVPTGPVKQRELLLLTKSDSEYAASVLNRHDVLHCYVASCNFLGYEGYDGSVSMHKTTYFSTDEDRRPGAFIEKVSRNILRAICHDRPIVPQSESAR